ncbi:uncharacterized protein [Choristoneura fumiferana]|uniref:uncharacterized protein n=1 Tax=Choristoneura fumiferana TaxID=7141 RepID=UPI003D15E3F7
MCKKSLLSLCILLYVCFWEYEAAAEVKKMRALVIQTCGEMDCYFNETISCTEKCGCDKIIPYHFNVTTGECVLNLKTLMISLAEKYKTQEKNRKRTERIFHGVMVSGIIVVTWASMCLFFICFYCCRIRYTDYQLRKSVKDVAKKFKEHHSANKKRLKDEKKYELEPCTAARQATSTV